MGKARNPEDFHPGFLKGVTKPVTRRTLESFYLEIDPKTKTKHRAIEICRYMKMAMERCLLTNEFLNLGNIGILYLKSCLRTGWNPKTQEKTNTIRERKSCRFRQSPHMTIMMWKKTNIDRELKYE